MAEALDVVLRLRRVAADDTRRQLSACLVAEEQSRLKMDEAEALISREAEAAADVGLGDGAVEAFAAWLPLGKAQAALARAEYEQLQSEVSRARAAVTVTRAATETAQNLLDHRNAERAIAKSNRAQAAFDDIVSRAKFMP